MSVATDTIERFFNQRLGKQFVFSVRNVEFKDTIVGVKKAVQKDMVNTPKKVLLDNGRFATPKCLEITGSQYKLFFVEDVIQNVTVGLDKLTIVMDYYTVSVRLTQ